MLQKTERTGKQAGRGSYPGGRSGRGHENGRIPEARASRAEKDEDGILLLAETRGTYPRVMETERSLETWCGMNYPLLKTIFSSGRLIMPVIPEVPATLARHPDGMEGKIYLDNRRTIERRREEILRSFIPVYTKVYSLMDETLRARVMRDKDFEAIHEEQNPLNLWKLVKQCAGGLLMDNLLDTRDSLRNDYQSYFMRDPLQSVLTYKENFDFLIKRMKDIQLSYSDDELALHWLKGLNRQRFGAFIAETMVKPDAQKPKTVQEAFDLALSWETAQRTHNHVNKSRAEWVAFHTFDNGRNTADRNTDGRGRGRGRGKDGLQPRDESENAPGTDHKHEAASKKSKQRCHKCSGFGHFRHECPSILVTVLATGSVCNPSEVILDGAANTSLFRDMDLWDYGSLENCKHLARINGINSKEEMIPTCKGLFYGIPVLGSEKASANIISEIGAKDLFYKFEIEDWGTRLVSKVDGSILDFVLKGGLKVLDMDDPVQLIPDDFATLWEEETRRKAEDFKSLNIFTTSTVAQNESMFNSREVNSAKKARDLHRNAGYCSIDTLVDMINHGAILNNPVSKNDLRNSVAIYGTSVPMLKGKTVRSKIPSVPDTFTRMIRRDAKLHMDIMWILGQPFIVALCVPIQVALSKPLQNRESGSIRRAVESMIHSLQAYGVEVVEVEHDPESGFSAAMEQMRGIIPNVTPVQGHDPMVERLIRQLKEIARSVIHGLPWDLPPSMVKHLVAYATKRRNSIFTSTLSTKITPWEGLTNRKIDYEKDFALGFGDYVQVHNPAVETKSMDPRTTAAIALYPTGNVDGSWAYLSLTTWRVINRTRGKSLPTPDIVIEVMQDKYESEMDGELDYRAYLDDLQMVDEDRVEPMVDLPVMVPIIQPEGGVPHTVDSEDDELGGDAEVGGDAPAEAVVDAQLQPFIPATDSLQSLLVTATAQMQQKKLTVRLAMKMFKEKTLDAIFKELKQIDEKGTWTPVDFTTISKSQFKKVVRTFMFLSEKYGPTGEFEKLKARLVAMGNQMDKKDVTMDTSAPTVATSSVFTILAIAAEERRKVRTLDIGGAFLHAPIPDDLEIFVKLDRVNTEMLCQIRPDYQQYVSSDGTISLKLLKALYGLVQSARLWYDRLVGVLKNGGFVMNPYDVCVWNHGEGKEQCTVVIHVDDMLATCCLESKLDMFEKLMKDEFGEVSVKHGPAFSYLGLFIELTNHGFCDVKMTAAVERLLSDYEVEGIAATPAAGHLFDIRESVGKLEEARRKKFHSGTQRLLYLSKHLRWDIITAVSFLTTRVLQPDEDDWKKLNRVLRYLNGTKNLCLRLGAKKIIGVIGSIDASYGIHPNGRSHSGSSISIGVGSVDAKSEKQKLTAKSSTEAEIIATSDHSSPMLGLKGLLEAQGYKCAPVIIEQDNQSCMLMLNRGRSDSGKTKHIDIRYFYLKDRIDNGEVTLKYVPTENMVSDFLTKPLQGALFLKLRAKLMGHDAEGSTHEGVCCADA